MTLTDPDPAVTSLQEQVAVALGAGYTISKAAAEFGINRVTVYRWLRNLPAFDPAVQRARAEHVLALRDKLHDAGNLALDTVMRSMTSQAPSVALRAAMFVLNRPQVPRVGWTLSEPVPSLQWDKLAIDSAIIEADYNLLRCLDQIETGTVPCGDPETAGSPEPVPPPESPAAPDPLARHGLTILSPIGADATLCNTLQQDPRTFAPQSPAEPPSRIPVRPETATPRPLPSSERPA